MQLALSILQSVEQRLLLRDLPVPSYHARGWTCEKPEAPELLRKDKKHKMHLSIYLLIFLLVLGSES